ncbi:764_t:CDS:2, partial [Funneliformis caledonium]
NTVGKSITSKYFPSNQRPTMQIKVYEIQVINEVSLAIGNSLKLLTSKSGSLRGLLIQCASTSDINNIIIS